MAWTDYPREDPSHGQPQYCQWPGLRRRMRAVTMMSTNCSGTSLPSAAFTASVYMWIPTFRHSSTARPGRVQRRSERIHKHPAGLPVRGSGPPLSKKGSSGRAARQLTNYGQGLPPRSHPEEGVPTFTRAELLVWRVASKPKVDPPLPHRRGAPCTVARHAHTAQGRGHADGTRPRRVGESQHYKAGEVSLGIPPRNRPLPVGRGPRLVGVLRPHHLPPPAVHRYGNRPLHQPRPVRVGDALVRGVDGARRVLGVGDRGHRALHQHVLDPRPAAPVGAPGEDGPGRAFASNGPGTPPGWFPFLRPDATIRYHRQGEYIRLPGGKGSTRAECRPETLCVLPIGCDRSTRISKWRLLLRRRMERALGRPGRYSVFHPLQCFSVSRRVLACIPVAESSGATLDSARAPLIWIGESIGIR
eukprot:gene342-biopygen1343